MRKDEISWRQFIFKSSLIIFGASALACAPIFESLVVSDLKREVVTDSVLESVFRENKEDFERLARMSDEDSTVTRIAFEFTKVAGKGSSTDTGVIGFSEERWDEYRSLFRKLRLEKGMYRYEDGSITFVAFAKGLSVNGISKGYLFNKNGENCTETSLDDLEKLRPPEGKPFNCKKIDEKWNLYVWR